MNFLEIAKNAAHKAGEIQLQGIGEPGKIDIVGSQHIELGHRRGAQEIEVQHVGGGRIDGAADGEITDLIDAAEQV